MFDKLKKNYEFSRVFKRGKRKVGKQLSIHYYKNNYNYNRIGITTVKNFGNAVKRNRMRRLIFEAYRSLSSDICQGYDIILMGRNSLEECKYQDIRGDLEHLLKNAKLLEVQ